MLDTLFPFFSRHTGGFQTKGDIVVNVSPRKETRFLENDAHARLIASLYLGKFYRTTGGLQKAWGDIKQGGLATAGGTN